jgi:hypothetical protein
MWYIIFFLCIFAAITSGDLKEELGTFVWLQWIIFGGTLLYMILSWLL